VEIRERVGREVPISLEELRDGGGVGVRVEVRLEADGGVPDRDGRRDRG